MDLVEEQNRALSAFSEPLARTLDGFANILDASGHGRELLEGPRCRSSDRQGQCGLAGSRWTPEQRRTQAIALHEAPQWAPRADEVLLTNHVVD